MRAVAVFAAVVFFWVAASALRDDARFATLQAAHAAPQLTWRQGAIIAERARTHACQDELHRHRTPVADRIVAGGPAYRRWVLTLWRKRTRLYCGAVRDLNANPVRAIRYVFGAHGDEAVHVASCETGGTFSVYAQNGQYRGLFQMGAYARSAYGHGYTPLQQAFAAHAYFTDAGWGPWECKP